MYTIRAPQVPELAGWTLDRIGLPRALRFNAARRPSRIPLRR